MTYEDYIATEIAYAEHKAALAKATEIIEKALKEAEEYMVSAEDKDGVIHYYAGRYEIIKKKENRYVNIMKGGRG